MFPQDKGGIGSWIYNKVLKDGVLVGHSDGANIGTTDWHWNSKDMKAARSVLSIYFGGGSALSAANKIVQVVGALGVINNIDNLTGSSSNIQNQNIKTNINYCKSAVDDANLVIGGYVAVKNPLDFYGTPSFGIDFSSFVGSQKQDKTQ